MSESKSPITDVQKLQRAIVDGLEDVKGQDIVVFNTEHLSPLFERVIIASGTSNRQTKALAMSVSEAVREADFPKPRMEGEVNGEWIIVDCGAAVVHVMQPNIRQYYHLEEIWGGKVVHLKSDAPVARKSAAKVASKSAAKAKAGASETAGVAPTRAPAKASAKRSATAASEETRVAAKRAPAAKRATKAAVADADVAAKPAAKVAKTAAKPAAKPAASAVKTAAKAPAKSATGVAAKKTPARKAAAAAGEGAAVKIKTLVVGKPPAKKAAAAKPATARAPRVRKSAG